MADAALAARFIARQVAAAGFKGFHRVEGLGGLGGQAGGPAVVADGSAVGLTVQQQADDLAVFNTAAGAADDDRCVVFAAVDDVIAGDRRDADSRCCAAVAEGAGYFGLITGLVADFGDYGFAGVEGLHDRPPAPTQTSCCCSPPV